MTGYKLSNNNSGYLLAEALLLLVLELVLPEGELGLGLGLPVNSMSVIRSLVMTGEQEVLNDKYKIHFEPLTSFSRCTTWTAITGTA